MGIGLYTGLSMPLGITQDNGLTLYRGIYAVENGSEVFSPSSTPFFPWDWENEFIITENSDGSFSTTYDPVNDRPNLAVNVRAYVDSINGNDGTASLNSTSNPYKSFAGARTAGANWFVANGGWYDQSTGFAAGVAFTADTIIESWDGNIVYINRAKETPTWAQESAPNDSVYKATGVTGTNNILDLTYGRNGTNAAIEYLVDNTTFTPIRYTSVASVAACQAAAGSYYDDGADTYVHTWDGRAPDANVKILSTDNVTNLTANAITLWVSMCEFWGNNPVAWNAASANTSRFVGVDSGFRFAGGTDDCLDIDDISNNRLVRCMATDALNADGFNYHRDVAGVDMFTLELDCYAARNGASGGSNNNGFTTHDRIAGHIRLNCISRENGGPNFADTAGSNVINLGCTSFDSAGGVGSNIGFQSGTFSTVYPAVVYLKNCTSTGDTASRSKSTGGQLLDLGGGVYQNGDSSGTIVLDGRNEYLKTMATVAPDAIVGWWETSSSQFVDIISNGVDDFFDLGPNKLNLADGGTRAPYEASNAVANGNSAAVFPSTLNSIYYLASKSATVKELVIVCAYKDGLDTTFDDFNVFMANSTGVKSIRGDSGLDTLDDDGVNSAATTVSKNGAAATATMLPTGYALFRFTCASGQTDTFRFFGDSSAANRGFQGPISAAFVSNRDLTSDEWTQISNAMYGEFGI